MANIDVTPGTGKTVSTETIGGAEYQNVFAGWGAAGATIKPDIASGKPFPVQLRGSDGTDRSNALPVTVASIPSHAVTNAGTFATQSAITAASGALAAGSVAAGAFVSGSVLSGAIAAGAMVDIGGQAASVYTSTDGSASGTVIALLKGIYVRNSSLVTNSVSLGNTTKSASLPVTMASDQDPAHDAADTGNPIKLGAKATASISGATMVAAADRTNMFAGLDGVLITRPHTNLEDIVKSGVITNTDGASTQLIAAQGSGIKTYITTVVIANTSATAVRVDLEDGVSGTPQVSFPVPANTSGIICNLPVPLGFTANTIVAFNASSAVSSIIISALGFKSKL